ncbi:MAG: plasmid replication protein [Bacteriophage sp.]|nr:MAG: plasmid replication protein [Bacteriophage sp.]
MEFNTKLIARRKVIETRKRLNKIVQSPFEINNTLKTVYQNNVVDNNKKYIITRQDYCRNFDVIKATTRKSVYVINHNIIFKGSIGDFIKEYNKYYENIDVIVNDKGKVVLE